MNELYLKKMETGDDFLDQLLQQDVNFVNSSAQFLENMEQDSPSVSVVQKWGIECDKVTHFHDEVTWVRQPNFHKRNILFLYDTLSPVKFKRLFRYVILLSIFTYTQLMAMVTWTKKKFKQIYQYRTKGTYCDYMGDYRKIKKQHSFRR